MVGDVVRLDEARRTVVDEDHVEIGGLAPLDRREIVLDDVLVGLTFAPPLPDVLALKPLVHQTEIVRSHPPESDRHAKRAASSPTSVCESCRSSARSAGSRCSGRRGPTMTAVTSGCASSHAIASVAVSAPRRAAASANRSKASNVLSVRRCAYGSGRIDMREPGGGGSLRLYFPVSHPPASGLNGA